MSELDKRSERDANIAGDDDEMMMDDGNMEADAVPTEDYELHVDQKYDDNDQLTGVAVAKDDTQS